MKHEKWKKIKRRCCEIRKSEGLNSLLKIIFFRGHSVQSVQNSVASKQNWPATHVVWHVNSSCCLMWWASQITLPGFQEHRFRIIRIPVYEWEGCPWRLLPAETFCTCVWIWGIKWPIALPPSWLCLIYFSQVSVIALWGEVDCCACEFCALCTCLGCLCSAEQSSLWLSLVWVQICVH